MSLVEFILACYEELEQVAHAASPGPWSPDADGNEVLAVDGITVAEGFALSGPQLRATVQHIRPYLRHPQEVTVLTTATSGNGRDKPKCDAKKRQGEGCCMRPAGWGTDHVGVGRCKLHGGNTGDHVKHAQRAQAAEAVKTFGLPREIDPRDALLEEVYRTAGAVDWLHRQVQALDPDEVIWGRTEEVARDSGEFPGTDTTYSAAAHAWVKLWQEERRHLLAVVKAAIAAGIEERKVKLAEQQGALLSDVIKRILADLGLTPEQQAKAPEVVVRHLRLVAGGQAA